LKKPAICLPESSEANKKDPFKSPRTIRTGFFAYISFLLSGLAKFELNIFIDFFLRLCYALTISLSISIDTVHFKQGGYKMNQAYVTLIIMGITAVLLVSECLPPAVTAVLCALSLALTKILTPAEAFGQFANTNIVLFAAMFIIGHAFFKCGLAKAISGTIQKFANSEKKLLLALLIISGVLSAFLSNTSTTAIFLPLVAGIAASTGFSRSKLLYSMVVAVGTGGCATFLGGPGWLFTKAQIEQSIPGTTVSMFEVGKVTFPLFIVSVIYMMLIGYKLTPDRQPSKEVEIVDSIPEDNMPHWQKSLVGIVMVLTILGMLFADKIKINATLTAVMGALVLVMTRCVTEAEMYRVISWRTLFLFGGVLPLSTALTKTGAGKMIADVMLTMMGGTNNPFVITAACMLVPCVLTQFLANNTTMTLFTPLGISLATAIGANPTAVIMAISIGAGLALATPIGQPGNAMIYGPSGLKFSDYAKPGLPLTILLYVISVILIPIVWPFF
jgi:anion transporter